MTDPPPSLMVRRLTSSGVLPLTSDCNNDGINKEGEDSNSNNNNNKTTSGNKRWNQFKMLMLLPNIKNNSSKLSSNNNKLSPYEKPPIYGRKRSNSAISLLFGHQPSQITCNLAAIQQPYSALVMQHSIESNHSALTANSSESSLVNLSISKPTMNDSDEQMLRRSPSPSSLSAAEPVKNSSPVSAIPPPIIIRPERRASSEVETRQLLRLEASLTDFKNSLSSLKSRLREQSYSRSQLEFDANTLLLALHSVFTACPEIANATDLHTLASQLMRLASLMPSPDGLANNRAVETADKRSFLLASSPSVVSSFPSAVHSIASSAVVSPHLRSEVLRCVDGLAVLVVRRLSRYISTSILSELQDQIADEEFLQQRKFQTAAGGESLTVSTLRQQGDPAADLLTDHCRRVAQAASASRLARSMTDVSTSFTPAVTSDVNSNETVINPGQVSSLMAQPQSQDALLSVSALSAATPGEDLDLIVGKLCRCDGSIEALLEQLRLTDRYLKDISSYVEKRTLYYLDYIKSLNKLANNLKPTLSGATSSSTAPLQYIFLPFVQHDVEYTSLALRSCQAQLSDRDAFVSIVTDRRTDLKRSEKAIQEKWTRVVSLYVAAMSEMRKAHQQYERAVDGLSKKRDEECLAKEADAQIQLRTKIMEVNHKLNLLEKTKSECIYEIIRQIGVVESTLKESSEKYFHFISIVICEHPSVYEAMRSQSRCIEVGSQFMAEIRRIFTESNPFIFEPIEFEQLRKSVKAQSDSGGTSVLASSITSMIPMPRALRVPLTVITSFDSDEDSPSRSSSPTPPDAQDSFANDAPSTSTTSGAASRRRKTRQESLTSNHCLSRLRTSSARCAICRSATVYEHGVKCDKCGLVFHRKCLDSSSTVCDSRRRSPIFGIDLATHLADTGQPVPLVLQKCIGTIERDALSVKGIYRVPGSKKQIETVCRALEEGSGNSVSLDEEQPHVLTGIVKSYLLQLPEPLFTTKLASSLLRSSREDRLTVEELQIAVKRLPEANYLTCGLILQHLKVVAARADENQMTISNLAIIFGPTLLLSVLRGQQTASNVVDPSEMWSTSMVDTVHASKVVEKLLINFDVIFDNLPLFLNDLRRSMSNGGGGGGDVGAINTETSPVRSLGKGPGDDLPLPGSSSPSSSQTTIARQSSNPLVPLATTDEVPPLTTQGMLSTGTASSVPPYYSASSSSPNSNSSKQSSPGPLPLAAPSVQPSAMPNATSSPISTAAPDLPPPTLTTILPFRPLQATSQQQPSSPSSSSAPTTNQSMSSSSFTPLQHSDSLTTPSTSTDTSIQSASVASVSAPLGKKMSNVIVRL